MEEETGELEELLCLLEKRLDQHDENRKKVQSDLQDIHTRTLEEADSLEERINSGIHKSFDPTEERILGIIDSLNSSKGRDELKSLIDDARKELFIERKYEFMHNESAKSFAASYFLDILAKPSVAKEKTIIAINHENATKEDIEKIVGKLKDHLDKIRDAMRATLDSVAGLCAQRREGADKLMERVNRELEGYFRNEDARLQEAVKMLREGIGSASNASNSTTSNDNNNDPDKLEELKAKAKATLVTCQRYVLDSPQKGYSLDGYTLSVTKKTNFDFVGLERRKPSNLVVSLTGRGVVSLFFTLFSRGEAKMLKLLKMPTRLSMSIWEKGKSEETASTSSEGYAVDNAKPIRVDEILASDTTYCLKVRVECQGSCTLWSEVAEFTTPGFKEWSVWRECPVYTIRDKRYTLNEDNPRIAKINDRYPQCTIIGNALLAPNAITAWSVKVLESRDDDGNGLYVGVAPFDINQNAYDSHGWFFNLFNSILCFGPRPRYKCKKYGPMKLFRKALTTGDSIGAVMNTANGELSFSVNGKDYGVAFGGIPLDKPLVPCVILECQGDSVELIAEEVKTINADSSVPVPSNITIKDVTCYSVALAWSPVKKAGLYQVEVDGNHIYKTTATAFNQEGLFPETEHSFRVRAVAKSLASEWSEAVKGKALEAPEFKECVWKECPSDADLKVKYVVDEKNPRIATNIGDKIICTIIGNTLIPLNTVTSWSIKILKSKNTNGNGIYIGVAPSDIKQNIFNCDKCGWYFHCYFSKLYSGPPHNYWGKEYGQRKECGQYVYTGDSVGVVMDTTKGDLSFVLNGVNHGVAYEGIPLDKPLVPCVIICNKGDSVKLDTSEVRENVDTSISIPSNITAEGTTWDSITLTWDRVADAPFYQIEMDGNKSRDVATTKSFTKRGLFAGTEHDFRVRALRGRLMSEWSSVVKRSTLGAPEFPECVWKEYPGYVGEERKYSVHEGNSRIATRIKDHWFNNICCAVVGNSPIPLNTVTAWSVKILKSKDNDGGDIYIGVAPSDANQGKTRNHEKCGWFFDCSHSTIWSSFSRDYRDKEYGPRKGYGEYVHDGDSVGVVMDTIKGELSFALNNVNYGVAFEGIPLDKPLVPCVILYNKGDSVELVI